MTIKCLYKFIYAIMKCDFTKPFLDLSKIQTMVIFCAMD